MLWAAPADPDRSPASPPWCCATAAALRRALLLAAAAAHTGAHGAVLGRPAGAGPERLARRSTRSALLVPEHHERASSWRPRSTPSATCAASAPRATTDFEEGFLFANAPEARLHRLPAAVPGHDDAGAPSAGTSACCGSRVEATTLASAPLIYFHRHHRSLEATWKYLLICSVGIALALLGNFFLAVAAAARRRARAT